MNAPQNWPFDGWLKLAVSAYRLSPHEFWQMSLRDWLALTRAEMGPTMNRGDLEKLLAEFPDTGEINDPD